MTDLRDRNRRFKALACLGVPVRGVWSVIWSPPEYLLPREGQEPPDGWTILPHKEVALRLECTLCGRKRTEYYRIFGDGPHDFEACERPTTEAILSAGCTHLAALLDPDPDNLADLIMLSELEKPGRV